MRGQATRKKILEKTLKLFQEKGILETSISDIEKQVGISKGSLYFHFPSKEALALETLKKARQDFRLFLSTAFSEGLPREALKRFLEMVYQKLKTEGFRTGCLFGNTALEMANREGPLRDLIAETFEEWQEELAKVLSKAQKKGCLCEEIKAEDLALFIIAVLEGAILLSKLQKSGQPLIRTFEILEKLIPFKENKS
ncbi:TetR/AcrR family transcriptional regulator [Thermosulfurimonas dismutans]|uniref:Transcriptional regulator, TetR family n=1 Tax=Thermosulfurimonas dismutans TaxID=999894 RepID=A0A179D5Z0_9BACT|nr:TetR/AcrR family transcriptional regulator [Thermosulfurimonas dismutans]OAQ21514.1 Transcriptional regulator, TetR family [Thermosulfurimonas dismutans]